MRWLVDGMNVIGSRPDGWWKDRDRAMGQLVERLERWAEPGDDEVTVVFEREPRPPISSEVIEVAHARRPGTDAGDDEIVHRLGAADDAGGWTVVTSDRRLTERARAAGAEVESASAFLARLDA